MVYYTIIYYIIIIYTIYILLLLLRLEYKFAFFFFYNFVIIIIKYYCLGLIIFSDFVLLDCCFLFISQLVILAFHLKLVLVSKLSVQTVMHAHSLHD